MPVKQLTLEDLLRGYYSRIDRKYARAYWRKHGSHIDFEKFLDKSTEIWQNTNCKYRSVAMKAAIKQLGFKQDLDEVLK